MSTEKRGAQTVHGEGDSDLRRLLAAQDLRPLNKENDGNSDSSPSPETVSRS